MTDRARTTVNTSGGPNVQGNHNFIMGAGSRVTTTRVPEPATKKSGIPELLTRWLAAAGALVALLAAAAKGMGWI
jgi:hypothetical protein